MNNENKQPDDAIARAKRILEAVDTYHECPDGGNRRALRSMLLDEFQELLDAHSTQQATKGDVRAVLDGAENFACYLIDNCEGETIKEEFIQSWLGKMLTNPRYARAAAPHAVAGSAEQAPRSMPEIFEALKQLKPDPALIEQMKACMEVFSPNEAVIGPYHVFEAGRRAIRAAKHDQVACSLVNGRGSKCTCDAADTAPTAPSLTTDAGAVLPSDVRDLLTECAGFHGQMVKGNWLSAEAKKLLAAHPTEQRMSDAELEQFLRMDEQFSDCNETDVDHSLLLKWVRNGLLDCTHYEVSEKGNAVIDAARKAETERNGRLEASNDND